MYIYIYYINYDTVYRSNHANKRPLKLLSALILSQKLNDRFYCLKFIYPIYVGLHFYKRKTYNTYETHISYVNVCIHSRVPV